MNPAARKKEIISLLEQAGSVQVADLARTLKVSKVTIRSDLDEMGQRGLLVRTHGGAITAERQGSSRFVSVTINEYADEKKAIAKIAASLVKGGQSIIIDNGSTTVHVAPFVSELPITVMTSSLLVVQQLMHAEKVDLLMAGGILRRPSMGLMGNYTKEFYRQIHADWCFLGASGYSATHGVFCTNLIEADSKQTMIKSASKVCLLSDSSKMERLSLAKVCDWDAIDYLITDAIEAETRSALEEQGVKVLTP
ncbi:MAG TPA: DeoR/GlpR family DNA-binding transcription regulator [Sphaerochaeta sp.]|jgi:DeoR family fructose operon transcriptional repressor|nr:DeoR/GlpR family DNA-binding transcription regulator [Sphaerochaeta sp.]HPZ15363.1 DeoR/GlpR family DNA-binding transcription regulator [Sphaerochaeta sp.]